MTDGWVRFSKDAAQVRELSDRLFNSMVELVALEDLAELVDNTDSALFKQQYRAMKPKAVARARLLVREITAQIKRKCATDDKVLEQHVDRMFGGKNAKTSKT